MQLSLLVLAQTLLFLPSAFAAIGSDGICRADCSTNECVFTVKVEATAGELGYYMFEECGDATNPTIGIEMGTTYRFVQVRTLCIIVQFFERAGVEVFESSSHSFSCSCNQSSFHY